MAQYNPHAQQGGRGGRGGGRGYGGPNNNQGQRPMGAWQPTAPTSSLQQATYGRPQPPPQQGGYQHPQQHQGPPPPHYAVNPAAHYNPYAAQQAYRGGAPQGGPGGWQPPPAYMQGGMYYPQAHPGAGGPGAGAAPPVVQPPKPREKKPLVITDKDGNVLDLRSETAKTKTSSLKTAVAQGPAAAAAAATPAAAKPADAAPKDAAAATSAPAPAQDAGSKLREAALARLKDDKPKEAPKKEEASAAPAPAPKAAPAPAPSKPAPAPVEKKAPTPAPAPAKEEKKAPVPAPVPAPAPAKEEKKEEPKPATPAPASAQPPKKSLADIAAAPPPPKPAPSKAASSSLQAAAQVPKKSLADIAAAPPPAPAKASASAGGLRPGGKMRASPSAAGAGSGARIVYDRQTLLKFRDLDVCKNRPEDLPDLVIVKGPAKQQGGHQGGNRGRGGGGGGGGNWDRGQAPPRRQSQNNNNNSGDWQRGQAPPNKKGSRGGRRDSNKNQPPMFDGPVKPLVKSENRWKPVKNAGPLQVAEKKVKGILNKMTKEKFERLSQQICDIHILSYDMLTMMIHNVYEKAIDEPSFGDMYADLCVRLSKGAAQANNNFVYIIESDEEPPMEDGDDGAESQPAGSSSHIVYRWSNDVGTNDDEIVGPFSTADECIDVALESSGEPKPRGDMELELVKLRIKQGMFIKIMKKKGASDSDYYVVYFPMEDAKDNGQQMSEIFLSEVECSSDAKKKNSFKRSLLNKCEDEFKKQDIYVDWKAEKKAYEETKGKLSAAEQAEREEELDFRRIKIKKQMLGNVKFIGQLYKKGLLKEKIMRFCISSLLKLEELKDVQSKNPEYKDNGDMDMDEEDHEAICSMFATIGSTIDKPPAADFMNVCFTKIEKLSNDKKNLPARSRFMYKDLLELRENKWVPRRDEGKAKTLEEIRKDVEKEERRQAQQSQQANYRDNRRGSQGGGGGYDNRRNSGGNFAGRGSSGGGGGRGRPGTKQPEVTIDEDGFTVIGRGTKGHFQVGGDSGGRGSKNNQSKQQEQQSMPRAGSRSSFSALVEEKKSAPESLSPEKLERRIKNMRGEYILNRSEEELGLSMDELSGTKDAGLTLVTKSADALLDCKEAERKAITDITRILFEQGKLSKDDIQNGLSEFIEFIDSMIIDCPKLFDFVGEWLGVLFVKKAVDVQWFCDTLEKTKQDPNTEAPEKLTRATISSIRSSAGVGAAKECFGGNSGAMNSLLGAEKWSAISKDLLG